MNTGFKNFILVMVASLLLTLLLTLAVVAVGCAPATEEAKNDFSVRAPLSLSGRDITEVGILNDGYTVYRYESQGFVCMIIVGKYRGESTSISCVVLQGD